MKNKGSLDLGECQFGLDGLHVVFVDLFLLPHCVVIALHLPQLVDLLDGLPLEVLGLLQQVVDARLLVLHLVQPLGHRVELVGVQHAPPLLPDFLHVVLVFRLNGGQHLLGAHLALAQLLVLRFQLLKILVAQLLVIYVDVEVLELLVDELIAERLLRQEEVLLLVFKLVAHDICLLSLAFVHPHRHHPDLALDLLHSPYFLLDLAHLRWIPLVDVEALHALTRLLGFIVILGLKMQPFLYSLDIGPLMLLYFLHFQL